MLGFLAVAWPQISFSSNFYQGVATNTPPWPGGIVPYVFDAGVTGAEQSVYLAGMREWELAANVHFVPHTTQTNYVILRFDYMQGTNTYVAGIPGVMTIDSLSRAQIGHETGHLLGFQHEHMRTDRNTYITVNFGNLMTGGATNGSGEGGGVAALYNIDTNSTLHGIYDFESVMHYGRTLFSIDPNTLDVMVPNASYFAQYYYRIGNYALSPGDRAGAAYLYGPPATPITNVVTTTADSGLGSLRAAIYYANDHPGTTIRFNIPTNDPGYSNGVYTIYTSGELPPLIANGTVIDATTQPGYVNHPVITIDGSQLIPQVTYTYDFFVSGLHIFAANCTVNGLAINNFPFVGINVEYAFAISNRIEGCYIGVAPNGTNAAGNNYQGISIDTGASRNFIGGTNPGQRNVIAGNGQYGVLILGTNGQYGATVIGTNSNNNIVLGNYIGLNATGTAALSHPFSGIGIWGGSSSNVIGGTATGSRNVISGNTQYGVFVSDSNTVGTVFQGNYIGTDATGGVGISNGSGGIGIFNGANTVTVGSTNAGAGNVLSGNGNAGLWLDGPGVTNNVVQGNYLGLNAGGTAAISNSVTGLYIVGGSHSNLIGGTVVGAANVFSGNFSYGLYISDPGTASNLVQGNFFGTGPQGTNAFPNGYTGIGIWNGTSNNLIGGTNAAARNIISGNAGQGIAMGDPGTSGNLIAGNYIGVASNGISALPNAGIGVYVETGPQNNVIGGTTPGAGNLISANGGDGIQIYGASHNFVQGNLVGTSANGLGRLGNSGSALSLFGGAQFNTIGGTSPAARNVFSGSTNYDGVYMYGVTNNVIQGNYIGTDISGLTVLANGVSGYGLTLFGGCQGNQILGNVIAASVNQGIFIADPGTSGNVIQGNDIGVGSDGVTALGNGQQGIIIGNSASGNVIGLGLAGSGAGNVIAHNNYEGIILYDTGTTGNIIRGNNIFSNGALGINLVGGTENSYGVTANHVGGAVPGPNDLQNYPVITVAATIPNLTAISGTLNSTANRSFLIDVYRNTSPDPSGNGEGQIYVGNTTMTTTGSGNGSFTLTANSSYTGQYFSATATDVTTGDTSEFSSDVVATNGPVPLLFTGPYGFNSNGFSFTLALNTNQNYTIQTATNLATNPVAWITLSNFVATNSLIQFTDHSATNHNILNRFYRAVTP